MAAGAGHMVAYLVFLVLIGPLSLNLFLPALPAVQQEFGASVGATQLTISLGLLAAMVGGAVAGPASDRWGRKPIVAASIGAFAGGALLAALAPNLEALLVGRALVAAGGTSCLILGRAVANDAFDNAQAVRLYSLISLAPVMAAGLGPVIGGALCDTLGWRWTFWLLLPLTIALAGMLATTPETRAARPAVVQGSGLRDGLRHLAVSPVLMAMVLIFSLHFAAVMTFVTVASHVMADLGHSGAAYGGGLLVTSFGLALGAMASGRVSDRIGRGGTVLAGTALALGGALLGGGVAALTGPVPGAVFLFAASTLAAVGIGLVAPVAQVEAMARSGHFGGLVASLLSLGPMLVGAAFVQGAGAADGDVLEWGAVLFLGALALALAAALQAQMRVMKESPSTP